MTDDAGDLDVFDQLTENTHETGEAGALELPQDPGWVDPDAVAGRPA